ncbi:MAG: DciA family protein [Atribacterota bacterium]
MTENRFFSGKPTPIGEILAEYLKKAGIAPQISAYSSLRHFGEWFPEIAAVAAPVRFSHGTLYLRVEDPLYTAQVKARVSAIREKFREAGLAVERVKIQCQ